MSNFLTTAIPSYEAYEAWKTPDQLRWLKALMDGNEKVIQQELLRCQRSAWHFLRAWVTTENVASKTSDPFEPFPDKPHLYFMTQLWLREKRLIVPKSRQMTITWLMGALLLWDCIFFPSRLNLIQSKKEEDADEVLERVWTMYQRLPLFMRNWQPLVAGKKTHCQMRFSRNRSRLLAIPEGPDHIRGLTPTRLFSDETVYQDDVERMVAAASPALGDHGQLVMVSSVGPSWFGEIVFDRSGV